MCGIAAIISLQGKKDLSPITKMTDMVKHRGPDGEGVVFLMDGRVALGHRRLSILDLTDAGAQPMESNGHYITYNGEIYNYLELKAELSKEGASFKTETDTEVILKAYQTYGISFLDKLNGMFSFVLLDTKIRKAFAVRDRFGVKPLYIYENEGLLSFSSEIKQFQAIPGFQARLNHQRAYDFLNFGVFDHTVETLYKNVHQVRGGHYAEVDLDEGTFSVKNWYKLPQKNSSISYDDAVQQCRSLLADSVAIRLRSDVEVGSCLSGGIDSSSIVCLASHQLNGQNLRQKTFSARSENSRFDEYSFMESVRERSGADAFYVTPKADDLLKNLENMLWHQDEPFASTSVFAQWTLFSKVKDEGIKVMLDGQGADEQLGGYHEFQGVFLKQLLKEGKLRALWQELTSFSPLRSLIKELIPTFLREQILYLKNKPSLNCPWIDFNVLRCEEELPFQRKKESFKTYAEEMLLESNLPMLLHYEDRNSMAHSVESRTPFLDYRFVEFIFSLPAEFFIKQGVTKALLRDAMRGIVPQMVLDRKDKIAFATDEHHWLNKNRDVFMKAIEESVQSTQIFKPLIIDKVKKILEKKAPFSFLPFRVIAFGKWFKLNKVII